MKDVLKFIPYKCYGMLWSAQVVGNLNFGFI